MNIEDNKLKQIIEAALMSVGKPMSVEQLLKLFIEEEQITASKVKEAVQQLQAECEGRGIELADVASGYRYQARQNYSEWISRLWEERPAKYSRATLETLALIAYRQPVTRGEIEDVRGVGVSSSIIKTLMEREWIRIVGHRDVPGRPALYATAKPFLDYFNMKSLEDLPTLSEIKDLEDINPELELPNPDVLEDEEENLDASANLESEKDTETESNIELEVESGDLTDIESAQNDESLIEEVEADFSNEEVNDEDAIENEIISESESMPKTEPRQESDQ